MGRKSNAIEWLEFSTLQSAHLSEAVALVSLLPDEECFIGGVEGVHFEFVVSIPESIRGYEHLHIIVIINRRVVGSEFCVNERFFHANSDIKILVIPNNRCAR